MYVSSGAVSGVVSGPPPVQRGPVLFRVGVACSRRQVGPGVSVRLSAPPCAPLCGPVSAVRRPFPPCFIVSVRSKRVERGYVRDLGFAGEKA